jgi:hypothetical protein
MQTEASRHLAGLKIPAHGVSSHTLKLRKGVALGSDAPASRVVPPCHVTARLGARFNSKSNFYDRLSYSTSAVSSTLPAAGRSATNKDEYRHACCVSCCNYGGLKSFTILT